MLSHDVKRAPLTITIQPDVRKGLEDRAKAAHLSVSRYAENIFRNLFAGTTAFVKPAAKKKQKAKTAKKGARK